MLWRIVRFVAGFAAAAQDRAGESGQSPRERRHRDPLDRWNCNGNVKNHAEEREAGEKADLPAG